MKALVYTGPEQLAFQDKPDPSPKEGEVVVRVESVGICGSDMHAFLGHDARRPAPLILGHEVAGSYADNSGQDIRVTVNPLVSCGTCPACTSGRDNLCQSREIISMPPREGGFAQAVAMPIGNLVAKASGALFSDATLTTAHAAMWQNLSPVFADVNITTHTTNKQEGYARENKLFGFEFYSLKRILRSYSMRNSCI